MAWQYSPEKEGERYERAIAAAGGIDLQILGIGRNAHVDKESGAMLP